MGPILCPAPFEVVGVGLFVGADWWFHRHDIGQTFALGVGYRQILGGEFQFELLAGVI